MGKMKHLFAKLLRKNIITLLAVLFAAVFFSGAADAALYDDFTNPGIDQTKWTATGPGFTQPGDGYLYYRGVTSNNARLISTALYTSGIFTMPFNDYISDNTAPPAQGLGSVVALGLGDQSNSQWVRIERGQVMGDLAHGITGGYIEVNWVLPSSPDPNRIYVNYVQSEIASGSFQLRYDGTDVSFFYRTIETDPWTQMVITGQGGQPVLDHGATQPLIITPGWTTAVPIFIQAVPGGNIANHDNYALSFKVDNINVSVPEPGAILLLAPGLTGFAILRKKFKK
jgi:hypothetical protein